MTRTASTVVIPGDSAALAPHECAWTRLHEKRLRDNPYVAPYMLGPLIRHLRTDQRVAFAYQGDPVAGEMVAAWPVAAATGGPLTLNNRASTTHPFVLDGTPLIHREHVGAAVTALLEWIDQPAACSTFTLNRTAVEDPLWQDTEREILARDRRLWARSRTRTPVLRRREDFDDYLAGLSSKRRSGWRAAQRKAQGKGQLEVRVVREADDAGALGERFLQLEAEGWKGNEGTALACTPGGPAFLVEMVEAAAAHNALLAVELLLDGKPLSVSLNFREGRRLFGFKTSYAVQHRGLAPGIQNLLEVIRVMHATPEIDLLESGAGETSFVRAFMPEFRHFADLQIATASFAGEACARLLPMAQRLARRALGVTTAA